MEKSIEYGIQKCIVGNDNIESTYVKFGDGLTRISTCKWDGELSGIQICRDESEVEPYAIFKGDEADKVNHLPELEKVYIVFDNTKSIDVMIERLNEAKEMITANF